MGSEAFVDLLESIRIITAAELQECLQSGERRGAVTNTPVAGASVRSQWVKIGVSQPVGHGTYEG